MFPFLPAFPLLMLTLVCGQSSTYALVCLFPQPEKPGPDGEELAADSVRAVSIRTLYLVSTTVDRMNSVSVCVFDLRRAA